MGSTKSRRMLAFIPMVLVGVGLGCAYARTLAPGVTWANDGADSGDLIAAAATLGVAHPTGYPTYLLLAHLFQLIPIGDLAFRSTIFSAVAAVLAALCVYLLVQRLTLPTFPCTGRGRTRMNADKGQSSAFVCVRPRPISAAIAALAIGLAPGFWSQAVIAEVYSLNALFVALILLFMLRAIQQPPPSAMVLDFSSKTTRHRMKLTAKTPRSPSSTFLPWRSWRLGGKKSFWSVSSRREQLPRRWADRVEAAIVGLALGNHVTAGFAAAAWLALAALGARREARVQVLLQRALWVGVGMLVYLYLPLRASAHPPVNWGDPRDWSGFWWAISGQPYRELAFGLPSDLIYGRVAAWAALLVQQFGWVGLGLGCFGLIYGAPHARRFVWISAGIAALASVFAITYNTDDSYAYLLPTYLIFAIWIGLGVAPALHALRRLHSLAAPIAGAGLLILLAWRAVSIAPQVDASQDRRAIIYATSVLTTAPQNAIIVSDSDLDTFPLWYYHYALGARPDLAVIVDPLLDFDWYRRNLHTTYPTLHIPDSTTQSRLDALAAANPRRSVCRTSATSDRALSCEP